MDRNQIFGLVLMLVLLTVYFQFFVEEPAPPEALGGNQDTTLVDPQVNTNVITEPVEVPDSVKSAEAYAQFGVFAPLTLEQEEKTLTIDNDVISIQFGSKGGQIKEVELKEFKTFDQKPLILVNDESSNIDVAFRHSGRRISLNNLNFATNSTSKTVTEGDSTTIIFTAALDENRSIQQIYTIKNGYEIGYNLKAVGMSNLIDPQDLEFNWLDKLRKVEQDLPQARNKTTVVYSEQGDVDDLGSRSNNEDKTFEQSVDWVSFSQKFFTSGIIANTKFKGGSISQSTDEADTTTVKTMTAKLTLPVNDFVGTGFDGKFFFGPNNFKVLKDVAPGFRENVDLGWSILKIINRFLIIEIFQFLERFISSYGLIIFIMVIFIKLLLSPLTYKSHMSMAKMRVLKPELDEIKEANDGDMQKTQAATMELYKKAGINPLSGCIPMVLQMPVLFSMFYFFPNSIELRQEGFLWAHDLSTYDAIFSWTAEIPLLSSFYGNHVSLFTLLMTASTILYTWSNSQVSSVTGPMKTMQYVMPIMFLFFLNSYSSGLTFYYFVSNIVSFGQIALFRKFVDEGKIRAIMEENKKKNANKKKSKFQSRLEEAMKASEQARKEKKKK